MMLFGAKLERLEDRCSWQLWRGITLLGATVEATFLNSDKQFSTIKWTIGVHWTDGTAVYGTGPTFDDAKRDCVRMLSERSREVGRV